jgi:transcriptional antiterminator RfaH
MNWYALYTKPKHEDLVALRLRNLGIEILNLKLISRKCSNNKLIECTEPLFPCYLFAKFDENKYTHLITYTRGIKYIVGKGKPIVVQDDVINSMKENTDDGVNVVIMSQRYQKGDTVFVNTGPLKDFYGIFEREVKGSERVMILLNTLSAFSCRALVNSYCLTKIQGIRSSQTVC